jgi:hypothetical protein
MKVSKSGIRVIAILNINDTYIVVKTRSLVEWIFALNVDLA